MNLLFEVQRDESSVTALEFPEMSALMGEVVSSEDVALASEILRANDKAVEEQAHLAMEDRLEQAREQGREEGLKAGERRRLADLEVERSAVRHLCESFAAERKRYFKEVEEEVVRLALAIATRVLQRESAMDPTLLKGVVKVALSKLGDEKGAVLRMNSDQVKAWAVEMKQSGVEVTGDSSLECGELRLEATGGVAELGIAAQLVEIERGFFDLLARKPA